MHALFIALLRLNMVITIPELRVDITATLTMACMLENLNWAGQLWNTVPSMLQCMLA